jgi:hypothetical protein
MYLWGLAISKRVNMHRYCREKKTIKFFSLYFNNVFKCFGIIALETCDSNFIKYDAIKVYPDVVVGT